ncbi:MAG: AmmeMemoRadiSam system protein B [Burkholderiales bacterium]|nr:MAG: AmmeMemoRadiSam system protein B [Burkholderiales bacterium]
MSASLSAPTASASPSGPSASSGPSGRSASSVPSVPSALHRPAAVAGSFYPADPAVLRADVERLLAAAPTRAPGTLGPGARPPKLLVLPHAGHRWSGACAARGWALLAPWVERITRVVMLAPAHRVALRTLAAPGSAAFDTPLGAVPIDRTTIDALAAAVPQVVIDDGAHAREHAIEVQLPFLQVVLGRAALLPLVVGDVDPAVVHEVVERLWGGDETLLVVSTDLSHYLPLERARAIDATTVARILRCDDTIGPFAACGATGLDGALRAARAHRLEPSLLDLRSSADAPGGDAARVVGYGAIAFRHAPGLDGDANGGDRPDLAAEADARLLGRALCGRARNAVAAALGLAERVPEPWHPALAQPGATFVTLQRDGRLRGCIGRLAAGPHRLEDDVRRNACRAAFEDPRFAPLAATEWPGLSVEVSLLGPVEPLGELDEAAAMRTIRPGVDGVILACAGRSATFLPQVWSQLPDPKVFFAALREKAGLPRDGWAPGTTLSRYGVAKFAEEAVGP